MKLTLLIAASLASCYKAACTGAGGEDDRCRSRQNGSGRTIPPPTIVVPTDAVPTVNPTNPSPVATRAITEPPITLAPAKVDPAKAPECADHLKATWSTGMSLDLNGSGVMKCSCRCCDGVKCFDESVDAPKEGCDCTCDIPRGAPGPAGCPGVAGGKGCVGKVGPIGGDGSPGYYGRPGRGGAVGAHGTDGADGKSGTNGKVGMIGWKGRSGTQGPPGPQGPGAATSSCAGARGNPGLPGIDGARGKDGEDGQAGEPGQPGLTGKNGIAGLAGDNGAVGIAGSDGKRGKAGARGAVSASGVPGEMGPKGEVGPDGAEGFIGQTGEAGRQGPAGTDGTVGARGVAGAPGMPGPAGAPGVNSEIDLVALESLTLTLLREALEALTAPACGQLAGDHEVCESCDKKSTKVEIAYVQPEAMVIAQPLVATMKEPETLEQLWDAVPIDDRVLIPDNGPKIIEAPVVQMESSGLSADLIFLLDGSHSITEGGWKSVRKWVIGILDKYQKTHKAVKSATIVIQYSNTVRIEVQRTVLAEVQKIQAHALRKKINAMVQMSQGTRTYTAFQYVLNNVIGVMPYDPHAKKCLILVTDGHANDDHMKKQMEVELENARKMFATQIVVGVGPEVNPEELSDFATDEKHVVQTTSYRAIEEVSPVVMRFLEDVLG